MRGVMKAHQRIRSYLGWIDAPVSHVDSAAFTMARGADRIDISDMPAAPSSIQTQGGSIARLNS